MAPLSDASVAAIVAAFSTTYGRFSVTESSRNKLVEVWRGKGETLAELPLDVDVDDVESWKTEWEAILDDAGINAKTERVRIILWLEARRGPKGAKRTDVSKTRQTLEILDKYGTVVPSGAIAKLERVMSASDAGNALDQCMSVVCVGILYMGQVFSEEDEDIWKRQKAAIAVKGGEAGFGRIEVRKFPGYLKLMSKSTEPNLERALRTPAGWRAYFAVTLQKFEAAGIPACSSMLQRVNTYAVSTWDSPTLQLRYLWHYFFEEHYGIGMPRKVQ